MLAPLPPQITGNRHVLQRKEGERTPLTSNPSGDADTSSLSWRLIRDVVMYEGCELDPPRGPWDVRLPPTVVVHGREMKGKPKHAAASRIHQREMLHQTPAPAPVQLHRFRDAMKRVPTSSPEATDQPPHFSDSTLYRKAGACEDKPTSVWSLYAQPATIYTKCAVGTLVWTYGRLWTREARVCACVRSPPSIPPSARCCVYHAYSIPARQPRWFTAEISDHRSENGRLLSYILYSFEERWYTSHSETANLENRHGTQQEQMGARILCRLVANGACHCARTAPASTNHTPQTAPARVGVKRMDIPSQIGQRKYSIIIVSLPSPHP